MGTHLFVIIGVLACGFTVIALILHNIDANIATIARIMEKHSD